MTAGDNSTPTSPPPPNNDEKDPAGGQGLASGPDGGDVGHVKAAALIKQFGGIRPMATKLGVPVSTVQGWKQRDAIPAARLSEIGAAATANGIVLDAPPAVETDDGTAVDSEPPGPPPNPARTGPGPPVGAPPSPPLRRGGGFAIALSVVAVLVSLGAAGGVLWLNSAGTGDAQQARAVSQRLEAVEADVAVATTLADRLAALERVGGGAEELARVIAGLEGDLAAVEASLSGEIETLLSAATGPTAGGPNASSAQLDLLERRLAAMEQAGPGGYASGLGSVRDRVDGVESSLIGLSETQSAFAAQLSAAATADALAVAGERIDALEARGEQLALLMGEIAGLEGRLAAIAADVVEPRALALVLALQQMRVAVAAGVPFAVELDLARRLAGGDSALAGPLASLDAQAASGLATADQLRAGFPNVVRALLQASLKADASASLADRLRARVAGVVSVRRTDVGGEEGGNDIDRALARADAALAMGDLAAVVTALAAYADGSPAEVVEWLMAARARAAAEEVIAQVDATAFAILSRAERE